MLAFDDIGEGFDFGAVAVDPEPMRDTYALLFPGDAASEFVPPDLLVALLMRGYLALVPDRPPGNVHAGQALAWGVPARFGIALRVGLRCVGKEWKRERRWLRFEARLNSAAGAHLTAVNTMIWGA